MTKLNLLGQPLEPCSMEPLTGFYRDGLCRTDNFDKGRHVVCAQVTEAFLDYTKSQGNDLSTPIPGVFPGLKPGVMVKYFRKEFNLLSLKTSYAQPVSGNSVLS